MMNRIEKEIKATVDLFEGDKVVRAKQSEYMVDKEIWKPDVNFVKLYDSGVDSIFDNLSEKEAGTLTGNDCKLLLKLIKYISYENGMLTKTGKNDSRYALINEDISKLTNINKRSVEKSMKKLVELSIFSRNKYGKCYQYYANPYIFFRGRFINKMLKDMFKKYAVKKGL